MSSESAAEIVFSTADSPFTTAQSWPWHVESLDDSWCCSGIQKALMPRKVSPRLHEDGYDDAPISDIVLTADDVGPLMSYLGTPPRLSPTDVASAIAGIAAEYARRVDRGADAFSRAEARAALDVILKQPLVTTRAVLSLNERALVAVHDQLMMTRGIWPSGSSPFEMLYNDQLQAETLRAACEAARDRIASIKGNDPDTALHICTDELCGFYERLTGKQVTLSNKGELLAYSRGPQSNGGRFVEMAIRLIVNDRDGHLEDWLPSRISGYIRQWIADRSIRRPVHTSRTNASDYRTIGCSLNEGEQQCTAANNATLHASPNTREDAHDQHHSRPPGRENSDQLAEAESEKRPDP